MPDNRPSIVDDVTSIRQGLRRLERERRLAQFRLPETVTIRFNVDHTDLEAPVNVNYLMHNRTLYLNKVRGGDLPIEDTINAFLRYLYEYCPSCRRINDFEIDLSAEDAALLKMLLRDRASDV